MKNSKTIVVFAVSLLAALAALTHALSKGAKPVRADSERNGQLHITKLCTAYNFMAGGHCTIATSNVPQLPHGTTVYYDQAAGTPAGFLDSNVMLVVASGDWAVGRCTVEAATGKGLCTVTDGVGPLAGFSARINVVIAAGGEPTYWDGTYSIEDLDNR